MRFFPLTLTLALGMTAAVHAQQSPALEHAQAGLRLQQSGDCHGAVAEYRESLATAPELAPVWVDLGVCLAQGGQFQPAIAAYRKALALAPSDAPARFNLAMAEYKTEQWRAAAGDLGKFRALQPGNFRAGLLQADCYLRLGENTKAIETAAPLAGSLSVTEASQLPAGASAALDYVLGTAYIRHGDLSEGERLIDHVMRGGDTPQVHLMLGEAYFERRDFAGATREFQAALKLDPKLPGANLRLGMARLFAGETDAALAAFEAEYKLDPNSFETNFYLGYIESQRNAFNAADKYLRRAEALRPDAYQPNFQLAVLAYQRNDLVEARRRLERAVHEHPNATAAHVMLGQIYYRLKMPAEGRREAELVRKLNEQKQAATTQRLKDNATPLPSTPASHP
ncbi:MAG: tetratricopeptide repeat protein [Terriglobales bacterium]